MKDPLNWGSRLEMEPPLALDARILGAASRRAGELAARRRRRYALGWMGAAAAVMIAATGAWLNYAPHREALPVAAAPAPRISGNELLALADWTQVEQENYDLSLTMNVGAKEALEF